MEVSIDKGHLVIRIALLDPPRPSQTGKTLVVASTQGNKVTAVQIDGKPVTVGLNAYIKR